MNNIPKDKIYDVSRGNISWNFARLIDSLPEYSGIVLPDGKVEVKPLADFGFESRLSLDAYLHGLVYSMATRMDKTGATFVPDELEEKVKNDFYRITKGRFDSLLFEPIAYNGSPKNARAFLEQLASAKYSC